MNLTYSIPQCFESLCCIAPLLFCMPHAYVVHRLAAMHKVHVIGPARSSNAKSPFLPLFFAAASLERLSAWHTRGISVIAIRA